MTKANQRVMSRTLPQNDDWGIWKKVEVQRDRKTAMTPGMWKVERQIVRGGNSGVVIPLATHPGRMVRSIRMC